MKALLFILSFFLCSVICLGQGFPTKQAVGNQDSTIVVTNSLQARSGFVNAIFTDTTAANLNKIRLYPGSQIYTSSDDELWLRNSTANKWVNFVVGGGGDIAITSMSDLRGIEGGAGSPLSKIVGTDNSVVILLGQYTAGDNGTKQYFWSPASTATDDTLTVVKPTATSGAGRWLIVTSSVINAAQAGIKVDGTNQQATLQAAVNNPIVKTLIVEHGDITISGKVVVPAGKVIEYRNGYRIKGDGGTADTLSGGIVDADFRKQIFDTTLTVLNLENNILSGMWFGMKQDMTTSVTGTNNNTPANRVVASAAILSKIYLPGRTDGTTYQYHYGFNGPWTISKTVEIYGDGYKSQTTLKFPGSGAGIILTSTLGGMVLSNLYIRGAFTSESGAYNSPTASGVIVRTNDCTLDRVYVSHFDGNGFHIDGSSFNANSWKALNCRTYNNGRAGWYTDGGDANAGRAEGLIAQRSGRWGIWDDSQLGNIYDGGSIGTNTYTDSRQKSLITYKAAVSHGGNRYRVLLANTNVEPGVTAGWATYWTLIGAGGSNTTFQAWSSSRGYASPVTYWARVDVTGVEPSVTANWHLSWRAFAINPIYGIEWYADSAYLSGGAQKYENLNGRSFISGVYNEGDGPVEVTNGPALIVGGFSAPHSNGNAIWATTNNRIYMNSSLNIDSIAASADGLSIAFKDVGLANLFKMADAASGGYINFKGGASDGFLPFVYFHPSGTNGNDNTFLFFDGSNSGSNAAVVLRAQNITQNGPLSSQAVIDIQNFSTSVLKIAATGQPTFSYLGLGGTKLVQATNSGALSLSSVDPTTLVTTTVLADSIDNRIVSVVRHTGTDSVFVVNYNNSQTFAFLTSAPGAGITSLNGLIDGTQTFAVGTSGSDFNISSVGTTHTFNIPDATALIRGLVTTGTQTFAGTKTFTGVVILQEGISTAVSGTNANFFVEGGLVTETSTASQFLVEGATGTNWRVSAYGSTASTQTVNYNYATFIIGNSLITEAASGNANLIASVILRPPTISAGAATASNTTTLYIESAPTATVSGQNSAAWLASGNLRLGKAGTASGTWSVEGSTSGVITFQPLAAAGTYTLTLPPNDGTAGQALVTDGSGILTWETVAGTGTVTSVAAGLGMVFTTITTSGSVVADTSYLVTKSTQQVISGQKNFTAGIQTLNIGVGTTQSTQFAATIGGSGYTLAALNVAASVTAQVSSDAYVAFVAGTIVEAGSGTHAGLYGLAISAPIITAGSATVTNAATLYIGSAPSGTFTNPATGIRVVGGVRFDGSTSGYAIINATAISGSTTLTLPAETGTLVQYTEASITSSSTPSPTGNARQNYLYITALAANATFAAPSGTAINGNNLIIRLVDNGVARTLNFNGIYRDGSSITLPTTTVINETMYLHFVYNSTALAWDFVGFTPNIIWILPFFFIGRPRKRKEYREAA